MIKKYGILFFRQISAVGVNKNTAGNVDACLLDGVVFEGIDFR